MELLRVLPRQIACSHGKELWGRSRPVLPTPVAHRLLLWTTTVVAEVLVFQAVVECGERSMGIEQR